MTITSSQILKKAGLTIADLDRYKDSPVRFLAYKAGGVTLHVESTANNIVDGVMHLPVFMQAKLFMAMADKVPEVGDTELLEDDTAHPKEPNKLRDGRITRLKSDSVDIVNLLLTR